MAAYAEARRVLVDGGQLTLAIWDALETNAFARVADEAVRPFVGDGSSFMARVPHGYHDRDRIMSDVVAGGFGSVDIATVAVTVRVPSAADAAYGFCRGTPTLADVPLPHEPIIEAVTRALLAELGTGDGDEIEGVDTALIVVAR